MGAISRGIKNTVRNPARAVSVVVMLGIAISFALSLLLANQAVKAKLGELKATSATTLSITPAGQAFGPGQFGGGEPLTDEMYKKAQEVDHITETGAVLTGGGIRFMKSAGGTTMDAPESEFDLESPLNGGTIGQRGLGSHLPEDFQIPVQSIGASGNLDQAGNNYQLADGEWFSADEPNQAVLGKDLAEHNGLSVGQTFTGYDRTFTVVGIYDANGDHFRNASVLLPLATVQELTDRADEITTITVRVDSIENVESVKNSLTHVLGEDAVNVTSNSQNIEAAISSLESIQRISIAGVVIAVAAAGAIVFMVMVMIVRERKREIAVLKAIGGSNLKIAGQFVTEAVVLTLASVVIGGLIALVSSNSLTNMLIATNTSDSAEVSQAHGQNTRGRIVGGPAAQADQTSANDLLRDVQTEVGTEFLIQGLVAVVIIGVLGSAIPAYAIAKVRPAEVLRSE